MVSFLGAPMNNRRRQALCIALGVFALMILLGVTHPTTRRMGSDYYAGAVNGDSDSAEGGSDSAEGKTESEAVKLKLPGPPNHDALRKWEDDLPQHNLDLPFPEGKTGRYLKFSNQMNFVGWNNCLNERLMNAHLAYMSKRAYVFNDYVWAQEHYPWPLAQQPAGGPRTPLNAIVSGPMAGGPWPNDDPAPRSISERWFDVVCPREQRRIIHTEDVKPALTSLPGNEVFAAWQKLLTDAPELCIEIVPPAWEVDSMPQVFDLQIWGTDRVVSLWDKFAVSPTSTGLGPSPIVRAAIARNEYLFLPRGPRPGPRDYAQRTLAIHLRRGDYLAHCRNLAAWGSTFYSWALLPAPHLLPQDKFTPLPGDDPKRIETMLGHCLPSNEQIVQKVNTAREDYVNAGRKGEGRLLDVLYLLTNEQGGEGNAWLDELKAELRGAGWRTIVTTKDLVLSVEEEEVSMAVDMQLAREAAVFIGNGWSSFTGNIIHQRLVDEREAVSIRLT